MPLPDPISDAEKRWIYRLHEDGMSRNQIARETGIAASAVSGICAAAGLKFDRSKVRAATAAKVADAKLIRASLHVRLLESAEDDLDAQDEPVTVYNFGGRDNTYAEHKLPKPSIEGRLKLRQAAAIAVDRALKLADYDADGGRDLPAVDRWLDAMTSGGDGGDTPPAGQGADGGPTQ